LRPRAPRTKRRTLQFSFFLAAIVAPCVLLIALSVRMVAQDRELAAKRIEDNRRLIADRASQRLLTRLERVKLGALGGAAAGDKRPPDNELIALVAELDGRRLMLPWETDPGPQRFRAALSGAAFARALAAGELLEFVRRERESAMAAYRKALAIAGSDEQRVVARLAILRTATSVGRRAEAAEVAEVLLRAPVSIVDEEGVPMCLYAARAFLAGPPEPEALHRQLLPVLSQVLDRDPPVNAVALHMTADLAGQLEQRDPSHDVALTDLARRASARLRDISQAQELRETWAAVRPRSPDTVDPVWVPFGPDNAVWLVTETRAIPPIRGAVVVAARAAPLFADAGASSGDPIDARLTRGGTADDEPLAPNFPGLYVSIPRTPPAGASLQRGFLLGTVALTLGVALFGAYFFWRDTQRDLRLAALRSQFVSSVSHELKTPLTAIRMFAETLRMGRTPPGTRDEYLDTIVNESERLTRLLNNVLDFSGIEQERRKYRLAPHALAPIVRSAARTLRYPLEQQGFVLNVAVEEEAIAAHCDPDAIEQALLNLLSNAMKYSGDHRTIDLRLTRSGDQALIAVADQGIGIPAAEQSRIFENFYRGAGADHQGIAGTGLGLAIVQHTVQAHGGAITVQSAPGEGSTFIVQLQASGQHLTLRT
jgi:signal transduction histidine kinase